MQSLSDEGVKNGRCSVRGIASQSALKPLRPSQVQFRPWACCRLVDSIQRCVPALIFGWFVLLALHAPFAVGSSRILLKAEDKQVCLLMQNDTIEQHTQAFIKQSCTT